jgi:hypothetical protein
MDVYLKAMGKRLPESQWIMRLRLDINLMYTYRVTIQNIVSILEQQYPPSVVCVASPDSLGVIDIYPDENRVVKVMRERKLPIPATDAAYYFLNLIVKSEIDDINIKGIPEISRMFPSTIPILSVVREEMKHYTSDEIGQVTVEEQNRMSRFWRLLLNGFKMNNTGITRRDVITLVETVGMTYYEDLSTSEYIVVEMPEINEVTNWGQLGMRKYQDESKKSKPRDFSNPRYFIQAWMEIDTEAAERLEEEHKENGNPLFMYPPSAITRAAYYTYADTNGTNLRAVLAREDVDKVHTISNNFHEIFQILGIEALRNYMIKDFIDVISVDGTYINPRHIILLVDFMTNQGVPVAISYTGISRQPTGPFTKAVFEHAIDIFRDAAAFGKSERINTVAANINFGKRAEFGTGAFQVVNDEQMRKQIEEYQKRLQENPQMKVGGDSLGEAIDALGDIEFGTATLTSEEDPDAKLDAIFSATTRSTTTQESPPTPQVTITSSTPMIQTKPTIPPITLKTPIIKRPAHQGSMLVIPQTLATKVQETKTDIIDPTSFLKLQKK